MNFQDAKRPPDARQPGLSFARQAIRAVIVAQLDEPGDRHIAAPSVKIMIRAVAPLALAFLVMATRLRAEENTVRFQTCVQFQRYGRELLAVYLRPRRG